MVGREGVWLAEMATDDWVAEMATDDWVADMATDNWVADMATVPDMTGYVLGRSFNAHAVEVK